MVQVTHRPLDTKFPEKLDDKVRNNVKGGWFGVIGTVINMSQGVPKPL